MVSDYSDAGQERWLADNGIDLLRGTGRLAGHGRGRGRRRAPHRRARRRSPCGADPFIPPIPGLRELDGIWTNREATGMKAVPRRLLVLGGGPVGVEMAQAVRRLGGEVVLVEGGEHVLAREPAPLGEALGEVLRRDGIELVLGAHATAARRDGEDYVLELDDGRELRGDRLLVATGRRPRVDGIGLETVGIEPDARGDPGRRAAARRRAPVGDRRRHRHLAADPRRQVPGPRRRGQHPRRAARGPLRGRAARHLHRPAGRRGRRDRGAASARPRWCPEVAKTATYTRAYAESNGFLTLLSDGERLTGAYALGPEAGEWLQQATLAIRARVPLDVLRDTIQPFPTFSEIYLAALKALRARDHRGASRSRRSSDGGIMTTATTGAATQREPALLGQTVVVIGGSAGIGLETARAARAEGADVILTARDPERLQRAGARARRAQHRGLRRHRPRPRSTGSSQSLPTPVDHVMVTAGRPYYAPLAEIDFDAGAPLVRRPSLAGASASPGTPPARCGPAARCCSWAAPAAGGRGLGLSLSRRCTAALPALVANLAVEVAPVRVNLIAAGFVDTPLSAELLGDQLEARRDELRATLPIGRVVGPADVAALAVHLMTNTALHRRDLRHRRRPAARVGRLRQP